MRTLLLLRGVQGSGKSTYIEKNELNPYTLCADDFRTLVCNPILNLEGDFHISQENDKLAWGMLLQALEERMKRGDFTIIDATHSTQKMVKNYKALAEMYKYTIFVKEFDVPLETCLERNRLREKYKFVPEDIIRKYHSLITKTSLSKGVLKINDISEIDNFYIDEISDKYKRVIVIGDLHSCNTALTELLEKEKFDKDTLYVFLGDYLDRGLEHKETFNKMVHLSKQSNVILLEGNHEKSLATWCQDRNERLSKKFINETLKPLIENKNEEEIEEFKSICRQFYKKLRQAYAFNFNGINYLCTHAGLPAVPNLAYISTEAMIKGVGGYDDNISGIYEENYKIGKCQNFTQIFGHRTNDTTEHSINLEGQVEFGGYLMYLVLTENGKEIKQIKNDVYDKDYFIKERLNYKQDTTNLTANEEVNKLIISRLVKVKPCKPNLLSLNFGENVFKKKIWNEVTIKARGLFVDKDSGEVKIRSYDKAFNYEERKETRDEELRKNLVFPMITKVKENGFLGLISVIDDEIVLATKSTTSGDWKNFFQKLWDREKEEVKEYLKEFIKKENCTLIFEVKSFNDKHIIDFETEELVLLDVVKNTLNLNGKNIDTNYSQEKISQLASAFENIKPNMIRIVETRQIINDFNEFKEFIKENKYKEIEGFMFTDNVGFMFKWKTEYYNKWKRVRKCYYYYINNTNDNFPFRKCEDSFEVGFMKWLISQDLDWVLKNHYVDIIKTFKKNIKLN